MRSSSFFIVVSVLALVLAGHFWNQLRIERQVAERAKEVEVDAQAENFPPLRPEVYQAASPPEILAAPTENEESLDRSPEIYQAVLSFERLYEENQQASDMHAAFLAQPQDPSFAYEMEGRLREFYEARPNVLKFGFPDIQCGPELCEVRLLANETKSSTEWAKLLLGSSAAGEEASPYQFVSMAMHEEGDMTALTILMAPPR